MLARALGNPGEVEAEQPEAALQEPEPVDPAAQHCGFVAIVGKPNVGKSTLLNALVGQKVSITSRKAQTTRHRITGLRTLGATQFVFVDTPGFQTRHGNALNRSLNKTVLGAVTDVDLIVFVVEAGNFHSADAKVLELLPKDAHVVVMNGVYGGTFRIMEDYRSRTSGLTTTYVDLNDLEAVAAAIKPETQLIWIESPTNPLLHLVDMAPFGEDVDPVQQVKAIAAELKKFDPKLYAKPRWLVLNKLDMVPADEREARVKDFVKRFRHKGPVFQISALTREGCELLVQKIFQHIVATREAEKPHVEVDPRFGRAEPPPPAAPQPRPPRRKKNSPAAPDDAPAPEPVDLGVVGGEPAGLAHGLQGVGDALHRRSLSGPARHARAPTGPAAAR